MSQQFNAHSEPMSGPEQEVQIDTPSIASEANPAVQDPALSGAPLQVPSAVTNTVVPNTSAIVLQVAASPQVYPVPHITNMPAITPPNPPARAEDGGIQSGPPSELTPRIVDEAARGYASPAIMPRVIGEKVGSSADEYELMKRRSELDAHEIALLKWENARLRAGSSVTPSASVKSGSGSVSAFKLNPNVVEAALPSMQATADPTMGVLPPNMKEVDVVDIKNPYFETAISSLYVRSTYYPPLWDEIKANILSPTNSHRPMITIVIGQPGIGKSVGFGNYCVLRCMADLSKTIIIVISMETVDVLFPPNSNNKEWQKYTARTYLLDIGGELCTLLETMDVKDHKALVVHDIKTAKGEKALPYQAGFLQPLQKLVARVHMVILTSPQESNYGLAGKEGVPFTEKYLPVWSREELECAGFDVQNKYEFCGGVPRSYAVTIDIIQNMQANASCAFDARLMRRVVLSDKCSSVLVKLDIAPDFNKKIGLSPVSMSAERLLRASHFEDVSHYFHDRIQCSRGTGKGLDLEEWFMFWIKGSTTTPIECEIENISDGASLKLNLSPDHYIQVEGNSFQKLLDAVKECDLQHNLNVGQSVLVQPKSTNFPVVDLLLFTKVNGNGVMWEVDAFQVTVSPSHAPPKASEKKFSEVFDAGSCRLRHFIWVGLTAGARSADPNGGVTTTQKVEGGDDFFPKKQYRLDMAQVVPK